jgi:hypothetical protein
MTTQDSENKHIKPELEDHETGEVRTGQSQSSRIKNLDDLTLAEFIGEFLRAPRAMVHALRDFDDPASPPAEDAVTAPAPAESEPARPRVVQHAIPSTADRAGANPPVHTDDSARQRQQLGLYFSAFVLAVWGCLILVSAHTRTEVIHLYTGAPFLLLGFAIWLGAELHGNWPAAQSWWNRFQARREASRQSDHENQEELSTPTIAGALAPGKWRSWQGIHPARVFAMLGLVFFGLLAWFDTTGNQFRVLGFWSWLASILMAVIIVAPSSWAPPRLLEHWRSWLSSFRLPDRGTLIALTVIMLLGAWFRLADLSGMPPEMTSDHVEKILDAQRVRDGARDVFFMNNGGRESFQMYAIALVSYLPGLEIDHYTLKLLSVLESLLTLPVMWLMGREVIGPRDRRLGNIVGLILAALVAVSYWHVSITRLALRIALTPLVTGLLVIFLSRAMRHNRRADFLWAGLILGFGLYTYQAIRMLPVVIVIGVGLAFIAHFRNGRMRRDYLFNLVALVLVAFVIFIPLFRFSMDYPEIFWMRTAGRILGDEIIQEIDEEGRIIRRNATIAERLDAFRENIPALAYNIRNALLMYNWKGDVGWISGLPNHPVMDWLTGALLIVGLAAWLALIARWRDPVHILIPLMVLIMLLPSALSIAMTLENPSATRSSGSLPPAYLLAAFPLALMAVGLRRIVPGRRGAVAAVGLVVIIVLGAYNINAQTYFVDYRRVYEASSRPYSEGGQILRGFEMSDGAYSNAFMIAFPHWWDHRAIGMEAGINDWPNGIVRLEDTPNFLHDAWACADHTYTLQPETDLLFFYNQRDDDTHQQIQEWFPSGRATLINSYQPNADFYIYRVPALGRQGMRDWLDEHATNPRCVLRATEES